MKMQFFLGITWYSIVDLHSPFLRFLILGFGDNDNENDDDDDNDNENENDDDNENDNENDDYDVPPLLLDEREPCRQVPWVPHISSQALNAPLICEARLENRWSLL